ncbi:CG30127, partial [Drosophila busckii]
AMTISVSHAAAQGNAPRHSGNNNSSSSSSTNSNCSTKPLPGYMSTRSAAMMALALGQQSTAERSKSKKTTSTTTPTPTPTPPPTSNASPRTHHRTVSTAQRVGNSRATPTSTPLPPPPTSKPSTPTAARAAAQLNGMSINSGGSNSSGSDNDGFSTSGSTTATALRRLYFKSGRSIKNKLNASTASAAVAAAAATPLNSLPLSAVSSAYHQTVGGVGSAMHAMGVAGVPKLVVMGTSSASIPDTNINTSTDSACTLITNVTHTDTSETCDSLDLGDNSGPSEPLFSSLEEPLLTAIQIDSEHETVNIGGATELELTSCTRSRYAQRPDMNLQDSTESQESCLSILTGEATSTTPLLATTRQPSTAPPPTRAREHFTFDLPQSPKSARSSEKARSHFSFKEDAQQKRTRNDAKQQQQQQQQQQKLKLSPSGNAGNAANQRKYSSSSSSGSSERNLRDVVAASAGSTMFPFDREALDYERIQRECFAPSSATASTSSDSDEADHCSVYERKLSSDIFQQYSRLTQQEQQQQQQHNHERDRERPPSRKNSKRIRPDSVIHTTIRENQQYVPQSDAFYPQAKSSSSPSDHSYTEINKFEDIASKFEQIPPKHGSNSNLNLHQLHMHSPGAINVTANPLETAAVCKQPRATIVVQQVS